jgi:hypothetical protein
MMFCICSRFTTAIIPPQYKVCPHMNMQSSMRQDTLMDAHLVEQLEDQRVSRSSWVPRYLGIWAAYLLPGYPLDTQVLVNTRLL